MPWMPFGTHPTPERPEPVLCAWPPYRPEAQWEMAILVHWPDGQWTDQAEVMLDPDTEDLPTHWKPLPAPPTTEAQQ